MQSARYGAEEIVLVANTRHGPEADRESGFGGDAPHDHLADPAEALAYLRRYGFAPPPGAPRAEHIAALREIREAAQAVARGNVREWQRRTERLLRGASYRLGIDGALLPLDEGWDAFVASLLPGLIALKEERGRLKPCGNPSCRWLFLDRSKNNSRQWCEMSSCGNRMKARRFRERHARD